MSVFLPSRAGLAGSPILLMARKAAELRAAGRDVVDLTLGKPDFPPPSHVLAAAREAIDAGMPGYTPVNGIPELRAAIRGALRRDRGLVAEGNEVAVGCGAKQVIFNAFLATLTAGDEVALPAPYWASYPDMVRLCGGVSVVVRTTPEGGFRLTPEALAAALSPRTRWVVLNAPGNPSGAVYSPDELRALAEVLAGFPRALVLSDDIYASIRFGRAEKSGEGPFATMAAVVPAMRGRTLTVDGVSKAYAMTGWRVGWGTGPVGLVAAMNDVQSQNCTQTATLSQLAAVAALEGPQEVLAERAATYRRRRDAALAILGTSPWLETWAPEGAFYLFPRLSPKLPDGDEVAEWLLDGTGLAVVPGSAFGMARHLRLSFATDEAILVEGCRRLVAWLDDSSARR